MQKDNSPLENSRKNKHTDDEPKDKEPTARNDSIEELENSISYTQNQKWISLVFGLTSIILYFIINQLTIIILTSGFKIDLTKAPISLTIPITGFTFLITALIITWIVTSKDKPKLNYFKKFVNLAKLSKFQWKPTLIGATLAPFIYIASITLATIASSFFPELAGGENQTSSRLAEATGLSVIIALTFVTVLTPIIEEIFFRGAMLGTLQRYSQTKLWNISTIIITSLIFGLLHSQGAPTNLANFMAIATPTLVGFTAAYLTIKHKSLYPAIALHIVYNSVVTIAIFALA